MQLRHTLSRAKLIVGLLHAFKCQCQELKRCCRILFTNKMVGGRFYCLVILSMSECILMSVKSMSTPQLLAATPGQGNVATVHTKTL